MTDSLSAHDDSDIRDVCVEVTTTFARPWRTTIEHVTVKVPSLWDSSSAALHGAELAHKNGACGWVMRPVAINGEPYNV